MTTTPRRGAAPPHTVILASAGTGKTHAITSRFLRLVAAGESADRILATTFTRKAAGEILRKVVSRLADGAASSERAARLGEEIGISDLRSSTCMSILGAIARSLDRLSVSTIDSFFARIASGHALTIGGGKWRMIDEDEDAELRAAAVSRVLAEGDRPEVLQLVRGRTPGVAGRSVHGDIMDGVDQAYRHYLTAAPDAWGALVIPPGLSEPDLALALQRLVDLAVPVNKNGAPNAHWSSAKQKAIAASAASRWLDFIENSLLVKILTGETAFSKVEIASETRRVLDPLIAHAASALLCELPARTVATRDMLSRFDSVYQHLKDTRGVCTFDDIPRMLLEHSASDSMREMYYRLDARLHHVLLDEFQDTSLTQWRLLEPIVDEVVSQGDDRSLLCVGDVKQSLYGWRNAEPQVLATMADRWPQIMETRLTASWRSSPVIIDTVNQVMGQLGTNPALSGARSNPGVVQALERWRRMFQTHTTHKKFAGFCRMVVSPEGQDMAELRDRSLRAAASRIKEIHREAPTRSIGVLFRSRGPIAAMKMELARGPDPLQASEEGGNPLADSPAVSAVLSLLTLTDHPGNSAALFHVATSPLGPVAGIRFGMSHIAVCETAAKLRLRLLAEGYGAVIEGWLRMTAASCSARDARRMDQLVALAIRFDTRSAQDPTTRPSRFVEYVKAQRVEDPSASAVRLMTMHASKGLEFDTVVLPWLDEPIAARSPAVLEDRPIDDPLATPTLVTLCPSKALISLNTDLQRLFNQWRGRQVLEELCILYVALTRAAHAIEMFVPPAKRALDEDPTVTLSFAKILRGALNPEIAPPDETLWTHGDPAWTTRDHPPTTSTPQRHALQPPAIRLDLRESSRQRHVPRQSPSAEPVVPSTATARSETAISIKPRPFRPRGMWSDLEHPLHSAARARGLLFHAWLELITWLEEPGPTDARLLEATRDVELPPDLPARDLVREFRAALGRAPLNAVLSRASYSTPNVVLRRELPFSIMSPAAQGQPPRMLVGRLDRLVVVSDSKGRTKHVEVIDFKTGETTDPSSTYESQMNAYRRAAARIVGCEEADVRTRLVLLTQGVVVEG